MKNRKKIRQVHHIEYSSTPEFFFLDDMDGHITSISVGEVWLYFYKQTLIGVRDMRNDRSVFLRIASQIKPDGYSHRHELTSEIMEKAMSEPYPSEAMRCPKRVMSFETLTSIAVGWVADSLLEQIDRVLA